MRLAALCDVDSKVLDAGVSRGQGQGARPSRAYTDIRKLLANKDIDAISIATPNHWHALATVWAVQAGKDVYVEKPVSHDVWEGEKWSQAAKRYDKIVQAGTQSRSSYGIKEAVEWVRSRQPGKNPRRPRPLLQAPSQHRQDHRAAAGPADALITIYGAARRPLTPPRRKRFHYDWHWFWDYGAGDVGNQGIHEMDVARWFLGEQTLSPRVLAVGGRLGYEDDGQTPNTLIMFHDYAKRAAHHGSPRPAGKGRFQENGQIQGRRLGIVIECEGGYVLVPDYNSAIAHDKDGKEIKRFEGASAIILRISSRPCAAATTSQLNAPILEGHLSTALCHTGNISYRLGSRQSPDAIREQIKGDKESLPTFQRMAEHLAANDVDLEKTPATLGVALRMNQATSKFIENDDANHLLTRAPREPYVIKLA